MDNSQKLTWRIWESPGMGKALLIGGLLAYVPLINLLLIGYYGRWAKRLIRGEGMELPQWQDGRALLEELGKVIIPWLVWLFVPFLIAGLLSWAISGLFHFMYLGFFASTLAWIPLAVVAMAAPPAMVLALVRLYRRDSLSDSLDVAGILQQVTRRFRACLFPLLQFYGMLAIGWPLIGFAGFAATLPLIAQLVLVFRDADGDLQSGQN
jgi:hypothetical protein